MRPALSAQFGQSQLPFAPDQIQATRNHQPAAHAHARGWQRAPQQPVDGKTTDAGAARKASVSMRVPMAPAAPMASSQPQCSSRMPTQFGAAYAVVNTVI